jgi:hypothetical protein
MITWSLFRRRKSDDLSARCKAYLEKGPPEHMTDYVPDSLTEIIIEFGAEGRELDAELTEVAEILVVEAESLREIEDAEIRAYMLEGAALVGEVLDAYGQRA